MAPPSQAASTPSASSSAVGAGGGADDVAQRTLERENDAIVDELVDRAQALKSRTQEIHSEIRQHNALLNGMSTEMDSAGSLLEGTLRRLDGLLNAGGGTGHLCVLVGFMVLVFLLVYWLFLR